MCTGPPPKPDFTIKRISTPLNTTAEHRAAMIIPARLRHKRRQKPPLLSLMLDVEVLVTIKLAVLWSLTNKGSISRGPMVVVIPFVALVLAAAALVTELPWYVFC
mmetsp:Transcript_10076/g.18373  ORF Transcript_10076/g.18373 Transcript_10076/m.18373 type:complete len:105 (+) Transcript_10076:1077-1391(+)